VEVVSTHNRRTRDSLHDNIQWECHLIHTGSAYLASNDPVVRDATAADSGAIILKANLQPAFSSFLAGTSNRWVVGAARLKTFWPRGRYRAYVTRGSEKSKNVSEAWGT
jgi:hypothetical protein